MILKLSKIKIAFCLLFALSAAFALSSCGGGDKSTAPTANGVLSIEFDTSLYTVENPVLAPVEYSFGKYGRTIKKSGNIDIGYMLYPEIGTPPSCLSIEAPNIPFVLKIDGSPADEVLSVKTWDAYFSTTPISIIETGDVTASYGNYFTLAPDGTVTITSSSTFLLKATVKSTSNGQEATFYFVYDGE